MKKILLVVALTVVSSLTFANDQESRGDILETRLEHTFQNKYGNNIDFDLTIYNADANVEIELEGDLPKNVSVNQVAKEVADYVATEAGAKNIFVTVEKEALFGEDEVLLTKTFKR